MNFPYNQVVEIICFIFSIIYLSNRKVTYWRGFIWFMLVVVITESTGHLLRFVFHHNNHWLYNLYLPIETLFIGWLFYKIFTPYFNSRLLVISGVAVFFVCYLIENVINKFSDFSMISNTYSNVLFTIFSLLYYYCLLKSDEYVNLYRFPTFWIVNGIFFFYFGSTACNLFFTYLATINQQAAVPLRYIIYIILNIILYSCWSYGFICKYRQKISS